MAGREDLSGLVEQLLSEQRRRWAAGDRISVEGLIADHPSLAEDEQDLLDLVYGEFCLREGLGETPDLEEFRRRFPQLVATLQKQIDARRALSGSLDASPALSDSLASSKVR